MIISRTPLRVSFCGGGSDLPAFYRRHGGGVLSMGLARYVYLSMHEYFGGSGYILKYSQLETPRDVSEIRHRIIKEVFRSYAIDGVDFNSSADVPAGTGLGSSSAFTVGLLNLCNAFLGRYVGREALAAEACDIEINRLGEQIGKQDQYCCAIGGLNFIEFHPDDSVTCEPVPMGREARRRIEQNLVMCYLGGTRSASQVLKEQSANMAQDQGVNEDLRAMVDLARALRLEIAGDPDVLGPYLHEGWSRKKRLAASISSPAIDTAYDRALAAGATGGKLLGAGGSGFLLLYAPGEARQAVVEALSSYRAYDVVMDTTGSTIIYSN